MNILIVNSSKEYDKIFSSLINGLKAKGSNFYFLCSSKKLVKQCSIDNQFVKRIYLGSKISSKFGFLFYLFFPFIFLKQLIYTAYLNKKNKIKIIILCNFNEKIIFSIIAKILKLKNIWIEYPSVRYKENSKLFLKILKFFALDAVIITFTDSSSEYFKLQVLGQINKKENLKIVQPGIKVGGAKRQDNIFSSLANNEQADFSKKYFTVGTILNLKSRRHIENLFCAVKLCLDIIPNLQIIIVDETNGDNYDLNQSKQINWLAKSMGIDSIVWCVSEKNYLKKWMDGFDIFIVFVDNARMKDLRIVMHAMASGLPIIGQRNRGLEDIIIDYGHGCKNVGDTKGKTGFLIESGNNQVLAQYIIFLFKNKRLRSDLGKEAIKLVDQKYRIEKMVEKFINIFNN